MKKCNSLQDVRTEIDRIDNKIIEFIAKRANYIHQAVAFKNSIDEIKAKDRIEEVLQRVRHKALSLNLSPNLVTKLYKIMIEDMVELEITEFRNGGNF